MAGKLMAGFGWAGLNPGDFNFITVQREGSIDAEPKQVGEMEASATLTPRCFATHRYAMGLKDSGYTVKQPKPGFFEATKEGAPTLYITTDKIPAAPKPEKPKKTEDGEGKKTRKKKSDGEAAPAPAPDAAPVTVTAVGDDE